MYPTADNVVHQFLRSQLPDIPPLCVWFIDAGTVQMNKTCGDTWVKMAELAKRLVCLPLAKEFKRQTLTETGNSAQPVKVVLCAKRANMCGTYKYNIRLERPTDEEAHG